MRTTLPRQPPAFPRSSLNIPPAFKFSAHTSYSLPDAPAASAYYVLTTVFCIHPLNEHAPFNLKLYFSTHATLPAVDTLCHNALTCFLLAYHQFLPLCSQWPPTATAEINASFSHNSTCLFCDPNQAAYLTGPHSATSVEGNPRLLLKLSFPSSKEKNPDTLQYCLRHPSLATSATEPPPSTRYISPEILQEISTHPCQYLGPLLSC